MYREKLERNAQLAVRALFPDLDDAAQDAIVWLIVDFLMSLDAAVQSDE